MNDLFRFLIMRQPDQPPADAATPLASNTPLHDQLIQASSSGDPRTAMQKVASDFLNSSQAAQSLSSLKLGDKIIPFLAQLPSAHSRDELNQLITKCFGREAKQLAQSADFTEDLQRLSDTLLALPLVPAPSAAATKTSLIDSYRALLLVQQLAVGGSASDAQLSAAMTKPLTVPAGLFPLPTVQEQQQATPSSPGMTEADQAALVKKATDLINALEALSRVSTIEIVQPAAPSPKAKPATSAKERVALTSLTADQRIVEAGRIRSLSTIASIPGTATIPSVLEQLPASAVTTIKSLGGQLTDLPLGPLTTAVRQEFSSVVSQFIRPGLGAIIGRWQPTSEPAQHDDATDAPPSVLNAPPNSHGTVAPAGIADLLVVRQHVLRYEPGEVAYVENVAAAEDFHRRTKRANATQTTVTVDQTTTSSQERDTQATSRFDLNRQTNDVLESDYARVPGAPNSETYGALVQSGGSKTDASSSATNFGQDVTSRAASQITQQFHTQTVTQTTASFEEEIAHHFDNSKGVSDKVVVYQWLDKICQAQVFSYGKRLLYDINVPEPGAFLLRALAHQQPDVLTIQKPLPFTVRPDELDDLSYLYYAAGYGATGVQAPPDLNRTLCMPWDIPPTAGDQPTINTTRSTTMNIPDGYSASKAIITVYYVFWETGADPNLTLTIGQRQLHFGGPTDGIKKATSLDGEFGQIPMSLLVDGPVYDCTIVVEILCTRTDSNYTNWQLRAYDTILQASRDRISEYETKWATLRAALQLLTFGQDADRKRQLQRTELQKSALAVLTNQQFDGLSAVEHSPQGYPQPFLPNVEPVGRYVRFLEQSFEWDQMMYLYYPYFWGRKPYWIDRVLVEDSDDQFGDFIRAGSARVIVPVRPGFEGVVGNFMATGVVPTTAELGQITSAEYLPFLAELQGQTDGPDTATPYGNKWEVRLPTTLTIVRKDATLPRWKQQTDAGGLITWVDDGSDPVG